METLVLNTTDLGEIVRRVGLNALMDEMMAHLSEAFIHYEPAKFRTPPRDGLHYLDPNYGLLEWMPTLENGKRITIKNVGYHPNNPILHRSSTILSTIQAFDPVNGHLLSIMDATFLTALRTGAASAILSKRLARAGSSTLGLIGAGAQAVTQLHALSRCFDIERVLVYDTKDSHAATFDERTSFSRAPQEILSRDSLPRMLEQVDILCTCTSEEPGKGPVFNDGTHTPWLHINAVGSDFEGKVELPFSLLQRSTVCPDFLAQAKKEGECQQLEDNEIGPGMIELLQHPSRYESLREELTVFDSTGWALEDHVGLTMISQYANEFNLGRMMNIELTASDPLDPYGSFSPMTTATERTY